MNVFQSVSYKRIYLIYIKVQLDLLKLKIEVIVERKQGTNLFDKFAT